VEKVSDEECVRADRQEADLVLYLIGLILIGLLALVEAAVPYRVG
jgi:hypothetical protein